MITFLIKLNFFNFIPNQNITMLIMNKKTSIFMLIFIFMIGTCSIISINSDKERDNRESYLKASLTWMNRGYQDLDYNDYYSVNNDEANETIEWYFKSWHSWDLTILCLLMNNAQYSNFVNNVNNVDLNYAISNSAYTELSDGTKKEDSVFRYISTSGWYIVFINIGSLQETTNLQYDITWDGGAPYQLPPTDWTPFIVLGVMGVIGLVICLFVYRKQKQKLERIQVQNLKRNLSTQSIYEQKENIPKVTQNMPTNISIVFCTHCGKKVTTEVEFCPACGKKQF